MRALNADQAFAYLLGELDEAQATALEDDVFADETVFDALSAFEGELVDAYVRGELPSRRRARFEVKWLATPEQRSRVETARALRDLARREAPPARLSWWHRLFSVPHVRWVLAGALVSAAVLVGWRLQPVPSVVATVSLRPLALRAQDSTPALRFVPRARAVRLELSLEDEPPRTGWEIVITGPGGEVWRGPPAVVDAVALGVEVPAALWGVGRHRVRVLAAGELVHEYEVLVEPSP